MILEINHPLFPAPVEVDLNTCEDDEEISCDFCVWYDRCAYFRDAVDCESFEDGR